MKLSLLFLAAVAPHSWGAEPCPAAPPRRPAPDPWHLRATTDAEVRALWRSLGITPRLKGGQEILCRERCQVDGIDLDRILDDPGDDQLVRVCGSDCRFLLFHKTPEREWTFVDSFDVTFAREAPEVSMVAAGDRRWIVTGFRVGGGTGVSSEWTNWHEVRCGRFRLVHRGVSRGHDINAQPARYFSTRFIDTRREGGREYLEFAYMVRFEEYEARRVLWQEQRRIVYSRLDGATAFTFDAARSDTPEQLIDKVFAYDSLEVDDFVKFAYGTLNRIAADPNDPRRDWLAGLLEPLTANARAAALRKSLGLR